MSENIIFNNDPDRITITKTRAIFGPNVYSVSQIASVQARIVQPKRTLPFALIAIGVTFGGLSALGVLSMMLYQDMAGVGGWLTCGGIGFWLLLTGVVTWVSGKTYYEVRIAHAGGESSAYSSYDYGLAQQVVKAIQTAIVERG